MRSLIAGVVVVAAVVVGIPVDADTADAATAPTAAAVGHHRAPTARCNRCRNPLGDGDRAIGRTDCPRCRRSAQRAADALRTVAPPDVAEALRPDVDPDRGWSS